MTIRFEKTGAERKALVAAISEIIGEKAQYLGAPGFVYRVGAYMISSNGTMDTGETGLEDVSTLLAALAERGFVPAEMPEFLLLAENDRHATDETDEAGETAGELTALSIDLPSDGFTDTTFDNINKLVQGKAALIRKALGDDLASDAQALPVLLEDGKVRFPWFRFCMDADSVAAWTYFVAALSDTAKRQKRVILREKPLAEGDSEKFAMRVFLLKLGFIGPESKEARRIILANLTGDGSHKSAKRAAQE